MSFRPLRLAALSLAAALHAPLLAAQGLTVERILRSPELSVRGVAFDWMADGRSYAAVEYNDSSRGTDLWVEGIRTGQRTRLVEGATLLAADTARPLPIEAYEWSPDRSTLLIFTNSQRVWRQNTKGQYYLYDVASKRLTPLSSRPGWQMFAKFSPDGARVGFVRDANLFVKDLRSGEERQLTTDGGDVVLNGVTDWAYEEELDLRDAWRWSPDGRRIGYWRFDQSPIPVYPLLDPLQPYPAVFPQRYPLAGAPNSRVKVGVLELESGRTTWMDVGDDPDVYLARMEFTGPTEVLIQRVPRRQNRIDLLLGDVGTGTVRQIFQETAPAWVDVDDDLTWVNGGKQFLWTSERDGWNHVYLVDRSGRILRQLTKGEFEVSAIDGVDERGGWVYFTAARPTPMERQLYRVRLDGTGMQRITPEPGTHGVNLNLAAGVFVDAYSRNGVPPVYSLRGLDGRVIRVLQDNARVLASLRAERLRAPEFFDFTTSDGVKLNGWMIRPPDFDPAKKYPVLMYVYQGPASQTVTDAWQGTRYLWHQLLAQRGYVVASVDGRGTGARGREFKNVVYQKLGQWESHDQIEAAKYLKSLPFVDASRVGIWGWSYGGYATAFTLERGGDVFRAGISVAPVTDWRLYDSIYTERYMLTPRENPDGYAQGSALVHAPALRSRFLLVHGGADDNVHPENSLQLDHRLVQAGTPFDFMLYPGQTHSISFGNAPVHLFTLLTKWVEENL